MSGFVINPSRFAVGGATGQESLDTVEASCVQDCDATISDSYFEGTLDAAAAVDKGGGLVGLPMTAHNFIAGQDITAAGSTNYNDDYSIVSVTANEIVITETFVSETFAGTETVESQAWLNLVSGGTVYDLMRGTDASSDTTDPDFVGTPGADTARFDLDGGDHFAYTTTDPAKILAMHMTSGANSGPTAGGMAFRLGDDTNFQVLFASGIGTPESFRVALVNNTTIRIQIWRGGSNVSADFTVPALDTTTDYLMWWAFDPTGTDDVQFWLNEDTGTTDTDPHSGTSSTPSTELVGWAAHATGNSNMKSGTRVYGTYFFVGTVFNDTIITALNVHIKLRHEAGRY